MGECKYCGLSAGLFSDKHKECEGKHTHSIKIIASTMRAYFQGSVSVANIEQEIKSGKINGYLSNDDIAEVAKAQLKEFTESLRLPYPPKILSVVDNFIKVLQGVSYNSLNTKGELSGIAKKIIHSFYVEYFTNKITLSQVSSRVNRVKSVIPLSIQDEQTAQLYALNKAAGNYLKNGVLTANEEQRITDFTQSLSVPTIYGSYDAVMYPEIEKLQQSMLLRNIQQGLIPNVSVNLPVLLSSKEKPLWIYDNISMYQEKVLRETVGRSGGFSFRVCKGVYYRTGQFRGRPVEHRSMELGGIGSLIITTQNLIFYSPNKSVKIPIRKLIGITPYSDGIEVHKDGATKRMTFQGFDSWFIVNVLSMIDNL